MTLRLAGPADHAEIVRMALNFKAVSPYATLPHDEEKINHVVRQFETPSTERICILAVAADQPCGMLAGISSEFFFGTDRLATELVWWVDHDKRKGRVGFRLKEAFEYWAKNVAKTKGITMAHLPGLTNMDKYYTRSGYSKVEENWFKVFV